MTIHERIREVRTGEGLSQTKFGEKIGVSRDVINNLELGRVEVKDYIKKLICSEFRIDEGWLDTGEGAKTIPLTQDEEFLQIITQIQVSEDEFIKRLLRAYWNLDEPEKAAVQKLINGLSGT